MNKIMWQFIGMCILFTVIPTIVVGGGHLTIYGVEMFTITSLLIPLAMKKVERLRFASGFDMKLYYHAYAWLFWTIFFFMGSGTMHLVIPLTNLMAIGALWFVVLAAIMIIITLTGVLLTKFFSRPKHREIIDTTLDMAVWTLPIPILLMGSVLYVNDVIAVMAAMNYMYTFLSYCFLLLLVFTMATIAVYLYPRKAIPKKIRFVRIFVTAFVWLAIVGHIMYGWFPKAILDLVPFVFPVYQASPLVFITPLVLFFIVLAIAVIVGAYAEYGLLKIRHNRRMKNMK